MRLIRFLKTKAFSFFWAQKDNKKIKTKMGGNLMIVNNDRYVKITTLIKQDSHYKYESAVVS